MMDNDIFKKRIMLYVFSIVIISVLLSFFFIAIFTNDYINWSSWNTYLFIGWGTAIFIIFIFGLFYMVKEIIEFRDSSKRKHE